jgi:hypothetical protein
MLREQYNSGNCQMAVIIANNVILKMLLNIFFNGRNSYLYYSIKLVKF